MSRGLNRSGDFRNGTPITLPHEFGNPVTLPKDFGNQVDWSPTPDHFGNSVTWPTPDPAHFGNIIGGGPAISGFELEDGSGVILLESGDILLLEVQ